MGKFNVNAKGKNTITNLAGGKSYRINDQKNELVMQVMTSFMEEPKYYRDNTDELVKSVRNMLDVDAKFVANLAIYTRREMYMRSVTHMMVAELAHHKDGKQYARKVVNLIAERVDDLTEITAYYLNHFGKPFPNSLKKGISDVILKQNEYTLAKYNRSGQVSLKDLIMLSHPRPETSMQEDLMKKVLDDTLETPITWETQLSAQDGRSKSEKWESLIDTNKLGYMAMLRNLRNIVNNCDGEHVDRALEVITNPELIKRNKQLPFRYFSAYRELQGCCVGSSKVLRAIETALDISVENIPRLPGKTLFIADVSGSMNIPISLRSAVTAMDIATLIMAIGNGISDDAVTSVFATDFEIVNASGRSVISDKQMFAGTNVGHGTNLSIAFQYILRNKMDFDRIIVLSDMQTCESRSSSSALFDEYRKTINPNTYLHSIDLMGYNLGTQFLPEKNINLMSGWSEKVLRYISTLENGIGSMIEHISEYAL